LSGKQEEKEEKEEEEEEEGEEEVEEGPALSQLAVGRRRCTGGVRTSRRRLCGKQRIAARVS
jgi:hypothetical protein